MQSSADADGERPSTISGTGSEPAAPSADPSLGRASRLSVLLWWTATLVTLAALDDLTFGPFFWLVSRVWSPAASAALVYLIYVPAQVTIVRRATGPEPGRVASYFLRRFDLQRRSARVGANERKLRDSVLGAGTAIPVTLLIGGVLPPLLLWRRGYEKRFVRRLSVATAVIYATEFALLHAVLPGII